MRERARGRQAGRKGEHFEYFKGRDGRGKSEGRQTNINNNNKGFI